MQRLLVENEKTVEKNTNLFSKKSNNSLPLIQTIVSFLLTQFPDHKSRRGKTEGAGYLRSSTEAAFTIELH